MSFSKFLLWTTDYFDYGLTFNKVSSLDDVDDIALSNVYLCKAHRLYEKRRWKEALDYYSRALPLIDNEEEKIQYQKYIDDCKGWLAKQ